MKDTSLAAFVLTGIVGLVGCAGGGGGAATDAAPEVPDGDVDERPDAAPDAGADAACPDGQVATGVAASGELTCTTVADAAAIAVRSRCSVFLGQRDSCDGCADPPSKWVETTPLSCSPGVGGGNACVAATLDAPVTLAALDLDGDVNDDDKLHATLHCIAVPRAPQPAPCAPGWAIAGRAGDTWMCAPVSEAAVGYVGARCAVYLGWQDSCDGCTSPPTKWGFASDAGCTVGAGSNGTCTTTTLDGEAVNLIGINTDGDVDGNDKLHVGVACAPPDATPTTAETTCPDGQFVIATSADGTFTCADPAAAFATYLAERCALYVGWRDSCDACTQPPTKWGKVGPGGCTSGAGADNTCTDVTLGDATLPMFGLSTDGDVNSDDTLYVGLRCDP